MKTKLNGILTLLLALVVQVAFAQQTVTGKVIDASGEGILGATVLVKGTQTGVTTDFDGNYSITASPENILVFSSTGYTRVEQAVGTQRVINVTLSTSLDVVVVQAYRSSTKLTSNIASSSVTGEETIDRPNANILQRLQGKVPGLNIQTASGQPGADSRIQLRGVSSLNGNTEPLFIVDGVPVNEDVFRSFNPNDIESTTVLKDAAGTAIYGNRGANGVIIIKTIGGRFDSPLRVSYAAQTSFSDNIDPDYNMYDARGILRLENRLATGLGGTLTNAEIDQFAINTNWQDAVFRTGINQNHNFSLSSGGKDVSQFTSIGYTDQQGTLNNTGLQRFSIRNNINGKSKNEKFRFGSNVYLAHAVNKEVARTDAATGENGIYFNPVRTAYQGKPYLDINDFPANGYNTGNIDALFADTALYPFVALDNFRNSGSETRDVKIIAGANAAYDLNDEFTVAYEAGMDYTQFENLSFTRPGAALALIRSGSRTNEFEGIVDESYSRDFRFNSNLSLRWKKKFGQGTEEEKKHTVLANGYLEYIKSHFKSFGFRQTGLDPRTFSPGDGDGFIPDIDANDENRNTVNSNKLTTGLFSYFGEVDYDYDSKYGFSGVLRRDNSFRFADANKWGTFFSVAARWNITEEAFMAENKTFDLLKLRVSYGEVGNERIRGGFYDGLNLNRQLFVTGQGYRDAPTFVRSGTIGNPNLSWETVASANVGIDFEMLDRRLRGSLDVYNRQTSDLFFVQNISGVNGTYTVDANVGDIQNRGIELGISYDLLRANNNNEVGLEVYFNGSYNRNKVLDIDSADGRIESNRQFNGGAPATVTVVQEGRMVNEFFAVPFIGINPANGNPLYLDINGNPTENPTNDDRVATGRSNNPDFQGSFGFNLTYKNFFVETQFNFITGMTVMDGDLAETLDPNSIDLFNLSADLERAWTPTNRVTDIPSLAAGNNTETAVATDRFLVDTDFLRFRFAQIGYNFPKSMTDNTFISSARVYLNAENLMTFTKFRGSDPETTRFVNLARYPTPRIIGLGFDINF